MRKKLALAAVALVALTSVGGALANHSWGSYHWSRAANPLALNVGDNVNSALGLVSQRCDLGLGCVECSRPDRSVRRDDGVDVLADQWSNRGLQRRLRQHRVARRSADLGEASHITQATTKVNDTYFDTAQYNTAAWRRLVMCQEVGHDFGLDHQDENFDNANLGTCMDYTNDPDGPPRTSTRTHTTTSSSRSIYAHLDGSGGGGKPCNPNKPGCQPNVGNAPPFSQASRARGDLYVDEAARRTPAHARLLGATRLDARRRSRNAEGRQSRPSRGGSGKGLLV